MLRFVEQTGIFKRLCSIAQYGARLDHCDAVSKEGTYIGAHLLGGVQELKPGYDAGQIEQELFVHLPATAEHEDKFFSFLREQIGKPYDPISIVYFFGIFSDRNWHDPGAWTCSELIAAALASSGILPENKVVPSSRVTPRDLYLVTSSIASGGADA